MKWFIPPMPSTGSYRQAAMQEPRTVSSNKGWRLACSPPIWMVMRVKSASRLDGRRVPAVRFGWMAFMLFLAPALVDAVTGGFKDIVPSVHGLRMTEHQITILP